MLRILLKEWVSLIFFFFSLSEFLVTSVCFSGRFVVFTLVVCMFSVEEALSRSAQLLENIKTDALVSPRCVSDVGSLNTDILLSVNPFNPADAINKITSSRESRSRHRYSYHTPGHHARSLSVGRVPSTAEQRSLRDTGRRRSVDSLGPLFPGEKGFQDLNSSMSVLSDSEDILKQLRAANASSASGSAQHQTMDANPRATGHTGPPSWIQELMPPTPAEKPNGTGSAALVDSIFSERGASGGHPAPSWVNGLEQSDIASSVDTQDLRDAADSLTLAGARKAAGCETTDRADDSSITDLSYAGPGLNFSDLITSPASGRHKVSFSDQLHHHPKPPGKVSRNNSFSGVGSSFRNSFSCKKDVDRSKPPVTISRIHQDLAGVETTRPKSYQTPTSLSSSVGADSSASILRKKVSEDSVYAKHSMDTYLSRLKSGSVESGDVVGKTDRETARIPRCSSVDTLHRVDGQGRMSSDITGASPITRDSNLCKCFPVLDSIVIIIVIHAFITPASSKSLLLWDATHTKIKYGLHCGEPRPVKGSSLRVLLLKPGVGQVMALHALPAARNSACAVSAFTVDCFRIKNLKQNDC